MTNFMRKHFSLLGSVSSKTQEDLFDTTQDQINKSWDVANIAQPHSATSHSSTVTAERRISPEDPAIVKNGTDRTSNLHLGPNRSIPERERDDLVVQFKDSDATIDQSGRGGGSTTHEGKHEDRVERGSPRREISPGKQRENASNYGPTFSKNATIFESSTEVVRRSDTLTSEGERKTKHVLSIIWTTWLICFTDTRQNLSLQPKPLRWWILSLRIIMKGNTQGSMNTPPSPCPRVRPLLKRILLLLMENKKTQ